MIYNIVTASNLCGYHTQRSQLVRLYSGADSIEDHMLHANLHLLSEVEMKELPRKRRPSLPKSHVIFAGSPSTMQHDHPPMTCECTTETFRIVTAIRETTCPPRPNASNHAISPGDVLGAGRMLIRSWERLDGCFNASAHLDAAMLRTIADAASGLIGLHEFVAVAAGILPGVGQSTTDRERGTSRVMSSSSSSSAMSTPSRASDNNALVAVQSPTYLGTHALEEGEAIMVGREALRHSILLLGEILHDISKDCGELGGSDVEDTRAILDRSSTDMLRLLGRINV